MNDLNMTATCSNSEGCITSLVHQLNVNPSLQEKLENPDVTFLGMGHKLACDL